jgi:Tropinone reductase 1
VILENNQPGTAFSGLNMDPWSLGDTRAIVTGAGRPIGAAIVAEMLGLGATVLGVARSREDLERLREVNPSAGDRLHVFSADLTAASQRRLVMVQAKDRLGGVDVLVNNAGVTFRAPASESDIEELRRVLELNLLAAFDLSRLAHTGSVRLVGAISSVFPPLAV